MGGEQPSLKTNRHSRIKLGVAVEIPAFAGMTSNNKHKGGLRSNISVTVSE